MTGQTYTHFYEEFDSPEMFICNDCGAYDGRPEDVKHLPTCVTALRDELAEVLKPEDLPADEQTRLAHGESDLGTRFIISGGEVLEI